MLVLAAFAVRWPHFFRDVIEWDESTFILMGQSLRDGHLPYVALWDNKPPLCFVPFALAILVFGKSIAAIRAVGLLCVAAAACLTSFVGERFGGRRVGLVAGLACVVFISYAPGGMATMSEVLAVVPLMGALAIAIADSPRRWFGVGLCLAAAMLIRTNLAIVAVAVSALALVEARRDATPAVARQLGFGLALPWAACCAPYVATGRLGVFMASVLAAPAAYALHGVIRRAAWLTSAALPWRRISSHGVSRGRALLERLLQDRTLVYVGTFALATVASIVVTGFGASHYWIQAHPFTAIVAAVVLDRLCMRRFASTGVRLRYAALSAASVIAVSASAMQDIPEDDAHVIYGSSVRVAAHIAARNPEKRPVLLFSNHLAYWLLDQEPLSKVMTHPTNLFRESALHAALGPDATALGETRRILEQAPLYIVRRDTIRFANTQPEALELIDATIARDYLYETHVDGTFIYRRK